MSNPFPLKMAGFELPTSGRFSLPGDITPFFDRLIERRVLQYQSSLMVRGAGG